MNLVGTETVALVVAIDEHGIVPAVSPSLEELEQSLLDGTV